MKSDENSNEFLELDSKIDKMVYKIYRLSSKEVLKIESIY